MLLHLPHGLNIAGFLRDYWQKKPLFLPNALPDYRCPLSPEELAGLACEEEVESRLVRERGGENPWESVSGPFVEQTFTRLPNSHWTLLVQDVDKHIPEVSELVEPFRFIPDWRLDDVMISLASDQGSVGPHVDDYDVFLVQARGRRRWQIDSEVTDDVAYIPGLDLRILADFSPKEEWILGPGDILYLPPNVAHWGIAEGDDCMTCSVGYRAPGVRELVSAWCDELILSRFTQDQRYRDPDLTSQLHSSEITPEALERIARQLQILDPHDPSYQSRWFGRFITEPKPHLQFDPPEIELSSKQFLTKLRKNGILLRNGRSRMAFVRGAQGKDYLFVNGREFTLDSCHIEFLDMLTSRQRLDAETLLHWISRSDCKRLIVELYNHGHFYFP